MLDASLASQLDSVGSIIAFSMSLAACSTLRQLSLVSVLQQRCGKYEPCVYSSGISSDHAPGSRGSPMPSFFAIELLRCGLVSLGRSPAF
jgi:hypothetical protein